MVAQRSLKSGTAGDPHRPADSKAARSTRTQPETPVTLQQETLGVCGREPAEVVSMAPARRSTTRSAATRTSIRRSAGSISTSTSGRFRAAPRRGFLCHDRDAVKRPPLAEGVVGW